MSGIYIKGMKMPKEDRAFCIIIHHDGKVCHFFDLQCKQIATAVSVPDHGDLIDKSGVEVLSWTDGEHGTDFEDGVLFVLDKLDELPVIIPAEGENYEAPAEVGEG